MCAYQTVECYNECNWRSYLRYFATHLREVKLRVKIAQSVVSVVLILCIVRVLVTSITGNVFFTAVGKTVECHLDVVNLFYKTLSCIVKRTVCYIELPKNTQIFQKNSKCIADFIDFRTSKTARFKLCFMILT